MRASLLRQIKKEEHQIVHLVFIGTKPDIIKQAPIYHSLKRRGELVLLCHTGQHFDYNNSKAILTELKLKPDIRFRISGSISEKLSQIIDETSRLIKSLRQIDKITIPYVHGDTLTACGVSLGCIFEKVAPVHIEAGLRTMTPLPKIYKKHIANLAKGHFDYDEYLKDIRNIHNYEFGSFEPFPEQIDTRMVDTISAIRFAPNTINYNNLISERNLTSGITTVGNTISDMVAETLIKISHDKKPTKKSQRDYILFTIHRRETCENKKRFRVVLDILEILLANNCSVVLILHPMFMRGVKSIDRNFVRRTAKKYPNTFIATKPIPNYIDAIKTISNCRIVITDSGGIQEEASILGKRCITLRYGTDRIETVTSGNNVLAPLINSTFAISIINHALQDPTPKTISLYGKNVADKIVNHVMQHVSTENGLFRTEEQRMDLL